MNRSIPVVAENADQLDHSIVSALTRCLQEEAAAIAAAAARLHADQVEGALTLLERCADRKAKLVITESLGCKGHLG